MSKMIKNEAGIGKIKILIPIIVVIAFLAGCGPQEAEKPRDQVTVQLKWIHQVQFAGCYLADKKGFYTEEGIDVTLKAGGPGIGPDTAFANLVDGKTTFVISGGEQVLTARARSQPVVAIAVIFQRNPRAYVSLKKSGIKRPKDFIGKRLMIPPDAESQHISLLRRQGIDPNAIIRIPYQRSAKPLINGEIDAHLVYRTGSGLMYDETGYELNFIWVDDYGIRLYADTIVTTEQLIRQNSDLVERFLKATLKGWRYAIENQAEAVNITLQYDTTLTKDRQLRMMESQMPLIHTGEAPLGWMEKSVWEGMQDTLKPESPSDKKIEIDNAFTMEFLHRIYGKLK